MQMTLQYDRIYRYCYYKLRDRDLAEDLTQETFARFFDSGYSEQGKMLRYHYSIARNLCIDYYRGQDHEIQDMRLVRIFGKFLINLQAAPILYLTCIAALVMVSVPVFRRRCVQR